MHADLKSRFDSHWQADAKTGCWLWTGDTGTRHGYGRMRVGGNKAKRAHRLAYELYLGPIPDGMCVCHRCDTPPCVNPDHLFLATNEGNTADRVKKNRSNGGRLGRPNPPKGEEHPMAKLTQEKAEQIRAFLDAGNRQEDIAAHFGVSQSTVSLIKLGKVWPRAAILKATGDAP